MLALSRSYVHTEYGEISQDEIDALAESAYEIAETAVSEFFEIRPVGVEVRVEEGSIDTIVTIGAYASALFAAISGYGNFWDGLSRIREHARIAGKFVCNQILKRSRAKGTSRVTTGHLTQLHRLFHRVESGELTADEATEKSLRIFVKAGEEISQQGNMGSGIGNSVLTWSLIRQLGTGSHFFCFVSTFLSLFSFSLTLLNLSQNLSIQKFFTAGG
jgi:hypothetical protein